MSSFGRSLPFLVGLGLAVLGLAPPAGATTEIRRAVVGAGGAAASASIADIHATVGQPAVGPATGVTASVASGFWVLVLPSPTATPPAELLPVVFRLYANHPNPFNPRTTVPFDLPDPASRVTVRLYDVSGRQVATLLDAPLPAGRHHVVWAGTDDRGRPVGSGIYYCVLETPQQRATSKLTLVR